MRSNETRLTNEIRGFNTLPPNEVQGAGGRNAQQPEPNRGRIQTLGSASRFGVTGDWGRIISGRWPTLSWTAHGTRERICEPIVHPQFCTLLLISHPVSPFYDHRFSFFLVFSNPDFRIMENDRFLPLLPPFLPKTLIDRRCYSFLNRFGSQFGKRSNFYAFQTEEEVGLANVILITREPAKNLCLASFEKRPKFP